jgi:hypothetical protein
LIRLLERSRVDYELLTDHDFALGRDYCTAYNTLIFNTHSEYWSKEMIGRLAQCIELGVAVAFLSGNNMYRRIKYIEHGCVVDDQTIDVERVAGLIGAGYDPLGDNTFAGYVTLAPDHWLFENAELAVGDRFGAGDQSSMNARGASGFETDKIFSTSKLFTLLAVGENLEGPAYMVCRDTPSGGWIFNAASVAFTSRIGHDTVIDRMVHNLVRSALSARRS